jgi:putative transposase
MKKSSENESVNATAFPERVSVVMAEVAENMQEGLLALAVGAGLQVMATLMEADVTALAGPKGRHDRPGLRCAMAVNKVRSPWVGVG